MSKIFSAEELCRQYWAAEEKCDIEKILTIYAKDAEFHGPDFDLYGEDDLRAFYTKNFANYPGLEMNIGRAFGDNSLICIEWTAKQTGADGHEYKLRGTYHANCDGKNINYVNVWFDRYDWKD